MAQGSPINDILQMKQQGISNNQIIQNLQRAGYTNTQIFDSMNQADTKMAVEGVQPGVLQQAPVQEPQPQQQQPQPSQQMFTQPPSDIPSNTFTSPSPSSTVDITPGSYTDSQVKTEELVEAIIEEKWSELIKDVNKIVEWKNKMENKISELEIQLGTLKDSFSDLNKAVIGKVNDYDKHILEVGSDIKAMEKVFSKVLPTFTENINELSRITNKIKGSGSK